MQKLLLTVTFLSFTLCASAGEPNNGNPHPQNTQEISITGKYIIFPVSNQGQRGRMTITVGDQVVHNLDCDFPPNADAIDWWTYLDMSEYSGKTAKVVAKAAPEICALFESSDAIRHLQPLYDEALRPQFHMSQMRGWNNDPNGMCHYDGQFHFFWQCNPAGRNWANYQSNPVIKHSGRDPKLMWYAPSKHWVIAVFDDDPKVGRNIAIYTSKNLKDWELASKLPGYFECAEIFALPIDGDPTKTKWVIYAADAQYALGHFDGQTFTPEHAGKHRVHWGAYYASQCFSNSPDGRVVQVGWARIDIPNMPFNQTFTVPTNLTLHTTEDGVRMFATPITELEQLRKPSPKTAANMELTAAAPVVKFDVKDQLFDIVVSVRKGTASKAVLRFGGNRATYDFNGQTLDEMPLRMKDGKVTFRVLVDRPMYELVGGDGACYKTSGRRDMGKPLGTISLTAEGGALTVESFTVYAMKSAWKKNLVF